MGRASSMRRHKMPVIDHLDTSVFCFFFFMRALFPLSTISFVFINFRVSGDESGKYICRLTFDLFQGQQWRFRQELRPALSQSPTYSHSAKSRPFCCRQKPDTTLNFISSRHATLRKGEKKGGEKDNIWVVLPSLTSVSPFPCLSPVIHYSHVSANRH